MCTPFQALALRFSLSPRALRWATSSALAMSTLIVLGGAVVRVTGSGLGCPEWPACTTESVAPTAETGLHGTIEFVNRLLTWVLSASVGWVILSARLQEAPQRAVLRSAWLQFWIVVLNAVLGGVTVWMNLNPYIVAAHFLAALLLLTAATVTWEWVRAGEDGEPVPPRACTLGRWLMLVSAVVVVLGTLVTGSGPHAGDSSEVPRMPLNWTGVTVVHGLAAALLLVLSLLLFRTLQGGGARTARRRVGFFVAALLTQVAFGIVQSVTGLPAGLVIVHVFGAALMWVGAVRVVLAVAVPPRGAAGAVGGRPILDAGLGSAAGSIAEK
ncbi:COX15/CtaA family protein (plasmid) [Rhodococcus pseudokoreensis]|nr:COX15/CtaA family protein [Rhodococcus pseudokoreensis]